MFSKLFCCRMLSSSANTRLSSAFLHTQKISSNVFLIQFDLPEKANRYTYEDLQQLQSALDKLESSKEFQMGILTGSGRHFSSGFDFNQIQDEQFAFCTKIQAQQFRLKEKEIRQKPLLAVLHGATVSSALELSLLCDYRLAEEDAIFGFYNRKFGIPLLHHTWNQLIFCLGLSRALELILTGRSFTAQQAFKWGLVDQLCPSGKGLEHALQIDSSIVTIQQFQSGWTPNGEEDEGKEFFNCSGFDQEYEKSAKEFESLQLYKHGRYRIARLVEILNAMNEKK